MRGPRIESPFLFALMAWIAATWVGLWLGGVFK